MKIFPFATAALFASVLAASAQVTVTPAQPTLGNAAGSTISITISGLTASQAWTATESASWLSVSQLSGTATAAGTVTLSLTAMTDGTTAKQAVDLVFTPTSGTAQNIPIFQEAAAATTTTTTTADIAAPTLTITAGSTKSVYQKAVISGTATDTGGGTGTTAAASSGVQQVYWREEGSSKWRKAMMGGRGTASATWFVNVTLKKKAGRRLFFKAVDGAGNEGVITDRFKWDTTGTVTTTTPTTTTTTPTVTTGS